MVLRAGLEPARIAPHAPQTCAATNYATSANFQLSKLDPAAYWASEFAAFAAGAAALVFVSAGAAAFALASLAGASAFVFDSAGTLAFAFASGAVPSVVAGASAGASGLLERTDTLPVNAGIESKRAETIKAAAAAIVILESTVAVPRGLNAELDTLLVNKAPASVLPGCSRTAATRITHERKNNPYKK